MCVNAQSCRQKSLALCDAISDNELDVALFIEACLYLQGDEAYVAQMTPEGYFTKSFPQTGRRGGGIAVTVKNSLKEYYTFQHLHSVSFEAVSLRIKCNGVILQVICLYRPPPSRLNKCSVQTFMTEFSDNFGPVHHSS